MFNSVRFGKAPVGPLRFNQPQFPDSIKDPSTKQNTTNVACLQIQPKKCSSSNSLALGISVSDRPFLGTPTEQDVPESEDCLFLDTYVPKSGLVKNAKPLPVIVWFYGGAYWFGSKAPGGALNISYPLYDGTGILRSAPGQVIFVAANYRVETLGWLAGQSMEAAAQSGKAVPNAGLYDQRLALIFVRQYIGLWGGDPGAVSV